MSITYDVRKLALQAFIDEVAAWVFTHDMPSPDPAVIYSFNKVYEGFAPKSKRRDLPTAGVFMPQDIKHERLGFRAAIDTSDYDVVDTKTSTFRVRQGEATGPLYIMIETTNDVQLSEICTVIENLFYTVIDENYLEIEDVYLSQSMIVTLSSIRDLSPEDKSSRDIHQALVECAFRLPIVREADSVIFKTITKTVTVT